MLIRFEEPLVLKFPSYIDREGLSIPIIFFRAIELADHGDHRPCQGFDLH